MKRSQSNLGDVSGSPAETQPRAVNTLIFDDYYEPVEDLDKAKADSHQSTSTDPVRRPKVDLNSSLSNVLPIESKERERVEKKNSQEIENLPEAEELTHLKNVRASLSLKSLEKKHVAKSHSGSSSSDSSSSSHEEKEPHRTKELPTGMRLRY